MPQPMGEHAGHRSMGAAAVSSAGMTRNEQDKLMAERKPVIFGRRYRLADGRSAWRSVGDEGVVLDLSHSVYFRLNRSGQVLWPMLMHGCTTTDLERSLVADRPVAGTVATAEVTAFLAAIDAAGLFDDSPTHG